MKDEKDEEECVDEQEDLASENDKLLKEIDAQKDKYLRLAAEYKNYQERSKKERLRTRTDASIDIVSSLLPVIDDIERTLPLFLEMEEKYSKGVSMILRKMHDSLKNLGIESFGEVGDDFDPSLHNASSKIEGEEGKTVISDVYQKGYKINGHLIRPAMVQVSG